ncbi:MAG: DNA polymerase I, partial [Armatimonadetes bacterium]|nr:DNA polymerase I [Armatimonadota bacterium]
MKKLLIVDGHSLLFRAFFGIPFLSTSEGIPTNAVYGFLRMIMNLLTQERPDMALVAFDAPGPTFRHESFDLYKANRAPMPEDLRPQIPLAQRLLDDLGVAHLETPGFEADDIIGTLTKMAESEGWKTVVVTGDNDSLQLVSESVEVWVNNRGVTDVTRYTPEMVKDKTGVTPGQIVDLKALKGDASDNIPGVPGVGDKTAASLIQEFGSVENLLGNLESVKRLSLRAALQQHGDRVVQNKELVTIVRDMALSTDWGQWQWEPPQPDRLRQILESYEFRALIRELGVEADPETTTEEFQWTTCETGDEIAAVAQAIKACGSCAVCFDYAVGGRASEVLAGLALYWGDDNAAYVPLACTTQSTGQGALFDEQVPGPTVDVGPLEQVLADPSVRKVTHDLKRALVAMAKSGAGRGFSWKEGQAGPTADLLIMSYLLNPLRQEHPIEEIYRELLGASFPTEGESPARTCRQAVAAWKVLPLVEKEMEAGNLRPLYDQVEHPLVAVLASMEHDGMLLDVDHLRVFDGRLGTEIQSLEADIHRLAGERFNIGSPKQLQQILFEKLNLPRGRKTKTGYSTDASVLEKLAKDHEVVQKILDYRELTKLKSTYVEGLLNLVDPRTRRVHTLLKQTGSATGRLSSAEPNLQNIPIRTELGREIRRAFICPPETHRLVSADYSQIELRVLAHISQDARLLHAFRNDEDIHTRTAADLYHVEPDGVEPEMRRTAKVINFGIAYGMSSYGLAANLDINPAEAQVIIDSYFATFPGVGAYMESIVAQARQTGYVTTLLHRRRSLPDINSPNRQAREFAERTAINTPIQGT